MKSSGPGMDDAKDWDDLAASVDRCVLTVVDLGEEDESSFWLGKTPRERLEAIEINRRIVYGYGSTPPRLQRLLETARRGES